jgi:hypothetical protein
MYTEAVDDAKLGLLTFEDRWHFIAILCCKGQGILEEVDVRLRFRMVAVKLGISVDQLILLAERLSNTSLIDKQSLAPSMEFVATVTNLRPSAEVWIKTRSRIFERDDYTCNYCGLRGVSLECDHVIPVSRGGSNNDDNLGAATAQNETSWLVNG